MGNGYAFICGNCGHEYSACLGLGMLPIDYHSFIKDVKAGKYGEERKALLGNHKLFAVDPRFYLYECMSCGNWKTDLDFTFYITVGSEENLNSKCGTKNAQDGEYVPEVKSYIHKCNNCGKIMCKKSFSQTSTLSCPKCGVENKINEEFMWD